MFTTEEYIRSLDILLPKLSVFQRLMLQTHYSAPSHTITAQQMASSLGWKHFVAANGHYGRLGRKIANAIEKTIEVLTDGNEYPVSVLADFRGGWVMWTELVTALERVGIVNPNDTFQSSDEFSHQETIYEGNTYSVRVNLYERSPFARPVCIKHYGTVCQICQFDFLDTYGQVMDGFIHVHHLKPLSEIGETYQVDPIKDLIPVCPNCHAVIHSRRPAYSPDEVRVMLRTGVSR